MSDANGERPFCFSCVADAFFYFFWQSIAFSLAALFLSFVFLHTYSCILVFSNPVFFVATNLEGKLSLEA